MSIHVVETTVKGKWTKFPAISYKGKSIITKGTWLRQAQLLDEEWLDTELEDPKACAELLKSQWREGFRADLLTFAQKLPNITPRYDFYTEWESIAAVRTTSFSEWWKGLPRQTRSNVERSKKRGVRVVIEPLNTKLINGIIGVNNECPLRQGKLNIHYRKTFEEVIRDHSLFADRSDYLCAYAGEELIGFIRLVYQGNVASTLQILTKESHADKRPANALIAKAIELCGQKRLSYLTFGMFNYGNKKRSSLTEFKKRNGFMETLVPRFYIPLTRWGKFCIKARLHRGPIGILPHEVIEAGLRVRSRFYDLWQSIAPAALSGYLSLIHNTSAIQKETEDSAGKRAAEEPSPLFPN